MLKETCLDRQYERTPLVLPPGATVVDVGAGIGEFAVDVAARFPACRVLACEPAPDTYALLVANAARNRLGNLVPLEVAVIPETPGGGPTAVLRPGRTAAERSAVSGEGDGTRVAATSLSRLFSEQGVTTCDFLKLDCEGAEFGILLGSDDALLGRVSRLCLEFHEAPGRPGREALVERLRAAGFRAAIRPSPVHPETGLLDAWRG